MRLGRLRFPILALVAALPVSSASAGIPITLTLTVTDAGPATPLGVSVILDHVIPANGWAFGLCHDPAGLAIESVGLGATGSTVNGGNPPGWYQFGIEPDGWTLGVVVDLDGVSVLPAGNGLEIGEAVYEGLADGAWSVCPCDTLGTPPIATVIVYSGASLVPVQVCGTVTVDTSLHEFRRGDANIDGQVDIADPIHVLDHLFLAGPQPPCAAAGDADGDGTTDIGDGIFLLSYLFASGPPPAPPFPGCGSDPAADCDVPACP